MQGRNLGALVELPAGARLPIVAKPMPPAERASKEARNEDLRTELRRILADRAPDNPNRMQSTGTMSAFDVVRLFTQSAQLDAELANYDAKGQPKTLAMGVLDKPTTAAGARSAARSAQSRTRSAHQRIRHHRRCATLRPWWRHRQRT